MDIFFNIFQISASIAIILVSCSLFIAIILMYCRLSITVVGSFVKFKSDTLNLKAGYHNNAKIRIDRVTQSLYSHPESGT